jgi:hypothetical protein
MPRREQAPLVVSHSGTASSITCCIRLRAAPLVVTSTGHGNNDPIASAICSTASDPRRRDQR